MENKTVKEIADKLGINKLRVYRFIDKNSIAPAETIKAINYYDKSAQAFIHQHFSEENDSKTVSSVSENDKSDNETDTAIELLLAEKTARIDFIAIQVAEKDKQIAIMQKLLDQQQQLSLQDKNLIQEQKERIRDLEGLIEAPQADNSEEKENMAEANETPEMASESVKVKKWYHFWK